MKSLNERVDEAAAKVYRLPRWAQEYVDHLERRAVAAERELTIIKQAHPDSNVFRVWGLRSDDQPLDKNAEIRFQIDEHDWHDSISVRHVRQEPGTLQIMGDRTIAIEPRSGNLIYVRLERR